MVAQGAEKIGSHEPEQEDSEKTENAKVAEEHDDNSGSNVVGSEVGIDEACQNAIVQAVSTPEEAAVVKTMLGKKSRSEQAQQYVWRVLMYL